ncbi:orotidine-5'-phosphate decarboxylase [Gottschalkiaceae bacterium SANA]|nr:orotidine-5'-phosphate decarboxylase [Gottschalkiaceae bacterium SANA]
MKMHELAIRSEEKGPVCLGLDVREAYLPEILKNDKGLSREEKIFQFNKEIILHTEEAVACFKVQIACYEALGLEGLRAYARTLEFARERGNIVVADVKRGDIASTAGMYAQGHFSGDFESDIMTVNAYMGEDAITPYFPHIEEQGKGLFALLRTSNPSAVDFQELKTDQGPLYLEVARKIEEWGGRLPRQGNFNAIGAVVGLTAPEAFEEIQAVMPHTFFLVPGYGAQGGTGKDLARVLTKSRCMVVNSSRGLITAHQGVEEGADFAKVIQAKTEAMREEILQWV